MKGKTLVIYKDNENLLPKGIYTVLKVVKTEGGYGHGRHDYYPPYQTITIVNRKGEEFTFRNGCHVKDYLSQDCYKIL
ncbi:hypothetical protein NVP1121O_119 [Vibrio phage 1.121.O._10N.286.46.C4]|nr:hypothetical protein NVP1121O_119 [Vibrio phage 1.121.O._10N.286.46.C4]